MEISLLKNVDCVGLVKFFNLYVLTDAFPPNLLLFKIQITYLFGFFGSFLLQVVFDFNFFTIVFVGINDGLI